MEKCDVKYALEIIQGKWRLKIMWELVKADKLRFNELQRRVGDISAIALSTELKKLAQLQLVARTDYDTVPPQVDYQLTALGRQIDQAIYGLGDWGYAVREQNN